MRRFLILSILIITSVNLSAQSCLPGGITFSTQAQIDSFPINYPNCTEIEGAVSIHHGDDITNLNGLSVLTSIGGDLEIEYNAILPNLSGLDNLTTIGGHLYIGGNVILNSLTGLDSLSSIGSLAIMNNDSLQNLQGLEGLTEIDGSLEIRGGLLDLNGLNNVTTIGSFVVNLNFKLKNFQGLESLTTIDGEFMIGWEGGNAMYFGNPSLRDFTGLENLTSIGGNFYIIDCDSLVSMAGLSNLNYVGGNMLFTRWYSANSALTNLSGLENVTSIGGHLQIRINPALTSLTGLDNLDSIGGGLTISGNNLLTDIMSLNNLNAASITDLSIIGNNSLSSCDAESICNYLSSPNGAVSIYNNASGCNNPNEVADDCGFTLDCLPYGNYFFFCQADVDTFQYLYPDCTELGGDVFINGDDISNLLGLNVVSSIDGELAIGAYYEGNSLLTNLSGLEELTSIGGSLIISSNDTLNSLSGLNNLTFIGGELMIRNNEKLSDITSLSNLHSIQGDLSIYGTALSSLIGLHHIDSIGGLSIGFNDELTDLALSALTYIRGGANISYNQALINMSGLENLVTVKGSLIISSNDVLTSITELESLEYIEGSLVIKSNPLLSSLAGLDNIEASSIENLTITDNTYLSYCSVLSICNYLSNPNGTIDIEGNTTGCNSPEEVQDSCYWVTVDEHSFTNNYVLYPNPSSGAVHLRYSILDIRYSKLEIYSIQGIKVKTLLYEVQQPGEYEFSFDVSELPAGMYYLRLQIGMQVETAKLVLLK